MTITGDFAKFDAWGRRFAALPRVVTETGETVKPLFVADVDEAFAAGASPDGTAFAADAADTFRRGSSATLVRSGGMASSVRAAMRAGAVGVAIGASYLRYQLGRGRDPLPSSMPASWSDRLRTAASDAFRKALA